MKIAVRLPNTRLQRDACRAPLSGFTAQRGTFVLRVDVVAGPIVSGSYEFDQSYVPAAVERIDAFLGGVVSAT